MAIGKDLGVMKQALAYLSGDEAAASVFAPEMLEKKLGGRVSKEAMSYAPLMAAGNLMDRQGLQRGLASMQEPGPGSIAEQLALSRASGSSMAPPPPQGHAIAEMMMQQAGNPQMQAAPTANQGIWRNQSQPQIDPSQNAPQRMAQGGPIRMAAGGYLNQLAAMSPEIQKMMFSAMGLQDRTPEQYLEEAGKFQAPDMMGQWREKLSDRMAAEDRDMAKGGWWDLAKMGLTAAATPGSWQSAWGKAGLGAIESMGNRKQAYKKAQRENDASMMALDQMDQNRLNEKYKAAGAASAADKAARATASKEAMSIAGDILKSQISAGPAWAQAKLNRDEFEYGKIKLAKQVEWMMKPVEEGGLGLSLDDARANAQSLMGNNQPDELKTLMSVMSSGNWPMIQGTPQGEAIKERVGYLMAQRNEREGKGGGGGGGGGKPDPRGLPAVAAASGPINDTAIQAYNEWVDSQEGLTPAARAQMKRDFLARANPANRAD